MAEIIIDNVKYTNVPNKKAGTKFASTLTQSNIGMSQAVQDYVNSSYFYALVNAIDINWDGIDIGENTYINTTSDLIKWIESKAGDIDLSSYATITYVNDKITELIGAAPETLDTLGEIAAALQDDASLAYVTQALEGKANVNDVYTKTEVDNLIPAPVDLSNYVSYTQANSYYVAKEDMPDLNDYATTSYVTTELDKKADLSDIVQADMCETDTTSKSYVLNNPYQYHFYNLYGSKYYCYNLIIPHNTNFNQTDILNSNIKNCVIIGDNHKIYTTLQNGLIQGYNNKIQNDYEVAFGKFNSSTHSSDASIRTIFSIGNGDLSTKHNALEVKGNGQIYIADTKAGTPYSLQSRLNSKANANDVYTKTEVDNLILAPVDLSNYVSYTQANSYYVAKEDMPDLTNYVSYTDANSYYMTVEGPKQVINSVKTFVGNKLINFKQGTLNDKLGFTLYNYDEKDAGGLEYRPNTINGNPLISLQHYVNTANMSTIPQSYLGFRQTQGNKKYHLLAPIPADVATIETITDKNYKNFFMPLVFKNGSNKVYTDCTGLVDMTSLMPDLNDYTTTSYVTTELNKKADLDDIPDLTPYVTYTDANTYYATIDYVTNELASKADIIDLSTYATTAQLDNRTLISNGEGETITTFGEHTLDDITEFDLKVHFIRDETLSIQIYANNIDSNSATLYLYKGSGSDTATDEYFKVNATYTGSDGDYEIWHFTCNDPINSISFTNNDGDGIEFEMSYGSSITVIENFTYYVSYTQANSYYVAKEDMPDMSNYVTYTDANSYYVDINSYNALAARVEELASWIVAYHTPGPGPEPSKPYATAQWLDSSGDVVPIGLKTVVAGDSTTYTFTFDGNPATGWTFTNTGAVQMMNTTTGDITIDVSNYTTSNTEYVSCEAYYPEDSSYQYSMLSFTVTILPIGTNPQFYYNPTSCNISSTDGQYMPTIYDSIGEGHTIEYASSDSNVATVGSDGTISYVGAGNCTITATAIDGSNNVLATATINVTCTSSTPTPEYTNVSIRYGVPHRGATNLPHGTFDTNPFEIGNGIGFDGYQLDCTVQFTGAEYDMNNFNPDFILTRDTNYAGNYTTVTGPFDPSNTYDNGVNTLTFNISLYAWSEPESGSGAPGTNRDVLTFTHNGVNYISDGIKSHIEAGIS